MGRLLLFLILFAGLLGAKPVSAGQSYPGPYRAEVIRVIDGDTILARVNLWPGLSLEIAVRLAGIDAPERREPGGAAAKAFLENLLGGGRATLLHPRLGKYAGRIVAEVRLEDGRDLGRLLVEAGHAVYQRN